MKPIEKVGSSGPHKPEACFIMGGGGGQKNWKFINLAQS